MENTGNIAASMPMVGSQHTGEAKRKRHFGVLAKAAVSLALIGYLFWTVGWENA